MSKHNQNSKNIKRPSLQTLNHEFVSESLTPFGGMAIVRKEIDRLNLKNEVDECFDVFNFRKELSLGDLFEQTILTMLSGGTCIHDTKLLKDKYLMELFGWERIPDDGTYSKRFSEFKEADILKLREMLRAKAHSHIKDENLMIAIDPTVETVCGNQEGAEVGYNPSKQGRRSYFPFIAYEYSQGCVLDAMLRPGNTSSSTNLVDFIKPLLKLRRRKGVTTRLDKGCTTDEVMTVVEDYGQYYIGKAKMFAPIWDAIDKVVNWTSLEGGYFIGEFIYRGRRHIVVEQTCNKKGEQLNLWGRHESKISVIVTNRPDRAETIWRYYNKGAMVETAIKELKNDLSALDFRTQSFHANEVFLLLGTVAWNIAKKIRSKEELKSHKNCALKKLRWLLIMIPAYITKSGRYIHLKLPKSVPFQDVVMDVFRNIRFT